MKNMKRMMAGALCASILFSQGAIKGFGEVQKAREEVVTTEEHIALSRQAAAEGMVLLENDGSLPLAAGEDVALFGCGQIRFQKGGGGSGDVNTLYVRSLLDGMQIKEEESKVSLYEPLVSAYTAYTAEHEDGEMPLEQQQVTRAARAADTAVVVITRYSGEGWDRNSGKGDFLLSDAEEDMLQKIKGARFKQVVAVLNIGGVIETTWIEQYGIDAVLVSWQAGMEGGLAAADILCGDANPSGKLADTFAKAYEDYPSSATFSESGRGDYINHTDDIFVGYRYFETVPGAAEKVNYPFGYGLSYTDFTLSKPAVQEKDGKITASVQVTNTGDRAGKEVVQAYFSAPQKDGGDVMLDKAAMELAAFGKTKLLEPGESETLTLSYDLSDMASYDDVGKTGKKSAYVLEPGEYQLFIGDSIRDAKARGACFTHRQEALAVTEQRTEELVPYRLEKRMLSDGTFENLDFALTHEVKAAGRNLIEAEDYTRASKDVRVEKFETGDGGRCLAGLSGGSVEYKLDVEEAGDYRVYLRMSNGLGKIEDAFEAYVDGQPQPGVRVDLPVTGNGEWYNFVDIAPFTVTLPAGECVLRMKAKGDCGNLDYLVLVKQKPVEHVVGSTAKVKIEAEDFMELDPRARTEDFQTPDGNGACIADMSSEGCYVTYKLKVEEAGSYKVVLHASNGWGELQDMLKVLVNDAEQPDISLTMPGTGIEGNPWHHYIDAEPFTVLLPAGTVLLTFVSNGTCGNLDSFTLEKAPGIRAAFYGAADSPAAGLKGKKAAEPLMLLDVYREPALMDDFIDQLSLRDLADLCSGQPSAIRWQTGGFGNMAEYGIPNSQMLDGPAGIHTNELTTAWPIATLLACTWNEGLLEEIGTAAAAEGLAVGADIWLAPALNIHRNILCGRNFEYYSEDPLVSGKMAAAMTRGTQDGGLGVAIKHFAANNRESNRNDVDSRISERALREIYLKGFEITVKEGAPWTVMSSYNFLNGQETSERYDLLTKILREEWGFDGLVMTDWGNNSFFWKEIKAGNNLKMPGGNPEDLVKAYEKGLLSRGDLEKNAVVILETIMKTNTFQARAVSPAYQSIAKYNTTRLDAIDYAWISSGIRPENCKDPDTWQDLGSLYEGEWISYNLDIAAEGAYKVACRLAAYGGGAFDIYIDDEKVGVFQNSINTDGWQNWRTAAPFQMELPAGRHTLKLVITQSGMNLQWLEFTSPLSAYTVSGKVEAGETGMEDVSGLEIHAFDKADQAFAHPLAKGTTDARGNFELEPVLPNGKYMLRIEGAAGKYKELTEAVDVADRNLIGIVLTLEKDRAALLKGDVNGDGKINISDVMGLCKVLARKAAQIPPEPEEIERGDLTGEGQITISDVMAVCKILASKV